MKIYYNARPRRELRAVIKEGLFLAACAAACYCTLLVFAACL